MIYNNVARHLNYLSFDIIYLNFIYDGTPPIVLTFVPWRNGVNPRILIMYIGEL